MKIFKRILLPVTSLSIIIGGSYLLDYVIRVHSYWMGVVLPVLMVLIIGVVYLAAMLINKIPE